MAYRYGEQTAYWKHRYPRRKQGMFPDEKQYNGFDWDEELAGPGGMHIHFWVPWGTPSTEVTKACRAIRVDQDVVSYGYGFIPDTVPEDRRYDVLLTYEEQEETTCERKRSKRESGFVDGAGI